MDWLDTFGRLGWRLPLVGIAGALMAWGVVLLIIVATITVPAYIEQWIEHVRGYYRKPGGER